MTELILRSRRVLLDDGPIAASIHVHGGRIERIAAYDDLPFGIELHDAADDVIMAGVVDAHVHVNEPGRTEWEGFETATRAAAFEASATESAA